jgi:hypothetical protein
VCVALLASSVGQGRWSVWTTDFSAQVSHHATDTEDSHPTHEKPTTLGQAGLLLRHTPLSSLQTTTAAPAGASSNRNRAAPASAPPAVMVLSIHQSSCPSVTPPFLAARLLSSGLLAPISVRRLLALLGCSAGGGLHTNRQATKAPSKHVCEQLVMWGARAAETASVGLLRLHLGHSQPLQ